MLDIKSEDYEGQLNRSQLLQRYATVKNAPTTGASQRLKLYSGSSTMIALREMHASASGRIE